MLRRWLLVTLTCVAIAGCGNSPSPISSPTPVKESAATQQSATDSDLAVLLDCARYRRAQAYLGRSFASVRQAASWNVPEGGRLGDVLARNRYMRVLAVLDPTGEVIAEVGVERHRLGA